MMDLSKRTPGVQRVTAKCIDLFIFIFLAAVLPAVVGPLLGFAYTMLGDSIQAGAFKGQSVGKMVIGLRVMSTRTREPATLRDSFIRNSPIGIVTFFSIIPFWGWLIMIVLGPPLMLIEAYLLFRVEKGHRLGDVMADTEVVPCETRLWNST